MDKVDKRADAYHAVVEAQAESWYSKLYPPYVMHIVETTLASMVEDRLDGRVKPRLTLEGLFDPGGEDARRPGREGARGADRRGRTKHAQVHRRAAALPAAAGHRRRSRSRRRTGSRSTERRRRMVVGRRAPARRLRRADHRTRHRAAETAPQLKEEEGYITTYDGPWTEVIDVHDFFWEESALSLTKSRYLIHRIRISRDELERGFKEGGPYGPEHGRHGRWKQVEKRLGSTKESKDEFTKRWGNDIDHNKDLLQIWEVLGPVHGRGDDDRRARRAHRLQGPLPLLPRAPAVHGVHDAVRPLQVRRHLAGGEGGGAAADAVVAVEPAHGQPASAQQRDRPLQPGARGRRRAGVRAGRDVAGGVSRSGDHVDAAAVSQAELSPGHRGADQGRHAEPRLAPSPSRSGAESQTVDQKTATGASIVTSLAQRSIDMAKQPVYRAWDGDPRTSTSSSTSSSSARPWPRSIPGEDDEDKVEIIVPEMLVGDYEWETEAMPSALMKQEKQAQGQAMLQLFLQAAPLILPLAQAGQTRMINFDKVITYYLEYDGHREPRAVLHRASRRRARSFPQGGQPPASGGGAGPGGQPLGITGPGLDRPGGVAGRADLLGTDRRTCSARWR